MLMYVFSFKNKFLGAYSQPFYVEVGPENYVSSMKRSILTTEDSSKLSKVSGTQLYFLGTFDDELCKFEILSDAKCLLDCDDVISQKKLIEVAKDVK